MFVVGTRTPFTGGAEALLRHTGRDGGNAGMDGKHSGETLENLGYWQAGALRKLAHLLVFVSGAYVPTLFEN